MTDIRLFSSQLSLKIQHDSNQVFYLKILSKMRLHCPVLNFLVRENMVEAR